MRKLVFAAAIATAVLGAAAPAYAQSPTVAATAPSPNAAAVLPAPEAAVAAYMTGQQAPGQQQVIPVQAGGGYALVIVPPTVPANQPANVTTLPARNWFEQENFYSFGSSAGPRN